MIRVEELTTRRGGRTVVPDVMFRCEPGTVTGFLGPNGAGKTTTMRILVDLSEPDSGEARILTGRGPPERRPHGPPRSPSRPSSWSTAFG